VGKDRLKSAMRPILGLPSDKSTESSYAAFAATPLRHFSLPWQRCQTLLGSTIHWASKGPIAHRKAKARRGPCWAGPSHAGPGRQAGADRLTLSHCLAGSRPFSPLARSFAVPHTRARSTATPNYQRPFSPDIYQQLSLNQKTRHPNGCPTQ